MITADVGYHKLPPAPTSKPESSTRLFHPSRQLGHTSCCTANGSAKDSNSILDCSAGDDGHRITNSRQSRGAQGGSAKCHISATYRGPTLPIKHLTVKA